MRPDEGAHYVTHGRISDPGARARLLSAMPSDPEELVTSRECNGGEILLYGKSASCNGSGLSSVRGV